MDISKIATGTNPPEDVNVIIEVPVGGEPVKYEFDKESGALFVDPHPAHADALTRPITGFTSRTRCRPTAIRSTPWSSRARRSFRACVVRCRPIAVLMLEDEQGGDEKILAVPVETTFPYYNRVGERSDLPHIVMQQIEHFFTHY